MFVRNGATLSKKAISEIISVIVILLVTISLVGTALMWGMPLITQRQDMIKLDRIKSYFNEDNSNSLLKKIEYVAKNGGKESIVLNADGLWVLHPYNESSANNNTIEFITFSTVDDPDYGLGWVSLIEGETCPPDQGLVGVNSPMIGCAKSELFAEGYNVTYRAWSRQLLDQSGDRGYKINLIKNPAGGLSSVARSVSISRERVYTYKTLFITEIKILLV